MIQFNMTDEHNNENEKAQLLMKENIIRKLKKSGDYERLRSEMLAELLLQPEWLEYILLGLHGNCTQQESVDVSLDELTAIVNDLGKEAPISKETKMKMIQNICKAIQKSNF